MNRVAALALAVALVVGATVVRDRLDGDGGDGVSSGGGDPSVVVCVKDLAEICDEVAADSGLKVLVEPLAVTVDRLTDPAAAPSDEVWVTFSPLPEMVADARRRSGLPELLSSPTRVVTAPLEVVAWTERLDRLSPSCGDDEVVVCLGRFAGQPWTAVAGEATWGPVKITLPDPDTASGAVALGALTAAWFAPDRDAAQVTSTDLSDPAFRAWLRGVLDSSVGRPGTASDVVSTMLTRGPAVADATVAAGPIAATAIADAARGGELSRRVSGTTVGIEIVALSPGTGPPGDVVGSATEVATAAGWIAGSGDAGGLPVGGVIEALVRLADELT